MLKKVRAPWLHLLGKVPRRATIPKRRLTDRLENKLFGAPQSNLEVDLAFLSYLDCDSFCSIRLFYDDSRSYEMAVEQDPFDHLLSLEAEFYKEGYDLGVSDGERAGLIEGRAFGLEKGFEKYITMGKLHGRATIWAGRLPDHKNEGTNKENMARKQKQSLNFEDLSAEEKKDEAGLNAASGEAPNLSANTRLEAHIRTLYALAEPGSLSTENNENSVSEFDDRLKRAEGKVKVIEKLTGEKAFVDASTTALPTGQGPIPKATTNKKGDGSIEDINSLHARH